jgi:hypothetical protein
MWLSSPTDIVLKTGVGLMGEGKPVFVNGSENCLKEHNKKEILHNGSIHVNITTPKYVDTRHRK